MSFAHLKFARHWDLSADTIYKLGQCQALVNAISTVPIRPELKAELKQVSLVKGAQATTAIEGNTLTEGEVKKVLAGGQLVESKIYQQQEVDNVIHAMNHVLDQSAPDLITPQLLKRYHRMIGKNLPAPFNATPGEFAQSQRTVGGYRCPPPGRGKNQVEGLVARLCDWLKKEFGFATGKQSFMDGIVQAVVTHVYIEWIHPFDDGNGRSGRLVEFYLLLRAGVPDICAHILSNHYNDTRPQYYAHIRNCQNACDLSDFIAYAVGGFLGGLVEVWEGIADDGLKRAWRMHVFTQFDKLKWNEPAATRRRQLLLDMPFDKTFDHQSIQLLSPKVAREYARKNISTVKRDINELVEVGLLVKDATSGEVSANTAILMSQYPNFIRS